MIPVVLDVGGRPVLVFGTTDEAVRKARIAASFGASVTLIGEDPPGNGGVDATVRVDLDALTREMLVPRIGEATAVFCDTGRQDVDELVSEVAQEVGTPVNVVDKPDLCTFIVPSYVRGRRFALAATTFGNAPMVSRLLREGLEDRLGWVDGLVELQADLRTELAEDGLSYEARTEILHRIGTDPEIRDAVRSGEATRARRRAEELLEATS